MGNELDGFYKNLAETKVRENTERGVFLAGEQRGRILLDGIFRLQNGFKVSAILNGTIIESAPKYEGAMFQPAGTKIAVVYSLSHQKNAEFFQEKLVRDLRSILGITAQDNFPLDVLFKDCFEGEADESGNRQGRLIRDGKIEKTQIEHSILRGVVVGFDCSVARRKENAPPSDIVFYNVKFSALPEMNFEEMVKERRSKM